MNNLLKLILNIKDSKLRINGELASLEDKQKFIDDYYSNRIQIKDRVYIINNIYDVIVY